ncbi:MAG: hypothetical protein ABJZ55_14125 [Fuerstiella sp.]
MSDQSPQNELAADERPSPDFVQAVLGMQIITGALAFGAACLTGVMLFLAKGDLGGQPEILSIIGFAMAAAHFVAHTIVPKFVMAKQLESIGKAELQSMAVEDQQMTVMTSMRSGHIIGSALLEGAVFFNAIAYMIEKWVGSLAIAGVFIVLILLRMPTVFGTQNKITDRLREIEMS